jgi:hypothetical protein
MVATLLRLREQLELQKKQLETRLCFRQVFFFEGLSGKREAIKA